MAIVVLTDPQKELLRTDPGFQNEVKWGILNKSVFWTGQDGVSPPGGDHIKWAKSRGYSAQIQINPGIAEGPVNVNQFLIILKDTPCVDNSQPFSTSATVAYLVSTNGFDAAADKWFDNTIETTPF